MSASTTLQLSLPMEQGRVGKPRLDPYSRLLSRFYEALFLLHSLDPTRALHAPHPISRCPERELRREFMRDLAFICDGQKGPLMFTAIGVAEVEEGGEVVFFVASKKSRKCKKMLERSLTMLLQYATAAKEKEPDFRQRFLEHCVGHARMRINTYISDLRVAIPACIRESKSSGRPVDEEFINWLRLLLLRDEDTTASHLKVCLEICRASTSEMMMARMQQEEQLQHRSYASQGLPHDQSGCFARARHAIGRLSARIRKPLSLLLNTSLMQDILARARVEAITSLPCVLKPEADHQTTLPRILRRMFRPSDDEDLLRTQKILVQMEQDSAIRPLTRYMDANRTCSPSVHSEIEVLEYFYKHKLKFLDDDRYVYSSKPACFACKLYFTHHPAKMVVPESHEKVYLNWGPPVTANFRKGDPASNRQRDLMIKITQAVRDEALAQIWGRSQPPGWHADTTTGVATLPPLEDGFYKGCFAHREQQSSAFGAYDSGFESAAERELLHAMEQREEKKVELGLQGQDTGGLIGMLNEVQDDVLHEERLSQTCSGNQDTDDEEVGALL
ncbi:hypothetical protein ISF_10019 [Cordyceps fumosorosea ARSEF 2679]|uniref:Uncharacterized protein n=1 Tax=Cordyceps fumosorosea (strain ARSEF 2679) TaxID=1081104 RepID=A0A166W1J3_CORFA|nr:hypothetical protein ISF_10020 [Cordyceps fumosorosea ARSEF 2679]XP_018699194.1 hypothetical protein ISF_10019 [Cordyceps fumosorosea ARSEF 2679]OAA34253.1 hypothetical protein ISF_10020 [Cordyceps fumosorosea ARSEF 2679]OAA34293.1 hypothetical protein ISF_10019 [Cordyceps fumosorosea ARSEF 2679]